MLPSNTAAPVALATHAPDGSRAATAFPSSIPPTLTPIPLSTSTGQTLRPTLAPLETKSQMDEQLGFALQVPVEWYELTDQASAQQEEVLYRQAWANHEDAEHLLSGVSPQLHDPLMVLTVQVDDEGTSSFPPPNSQLKKTPFGQEVAAQTVSGAEAAPFALRQSYTIARTPYHYILELGCLFPPAADSTTQATFEAECRDTWQRLSFDFGLCPLPSVPVSAADSWQVVNDEYYGYAFEVPASWQQEEHPTADMLTFLTDLSVIGQPRACQLPNGLMEFDLTVNPPGNFLPADGPDRTGYEQLADSPAPTWIRFFDETEVGIEGASIEGLTVTSVHIQGQEYWYSLSFQCHAPTGSDDEAQAAFQTQCDMVFTHILDSFQVR